MSLLLALFILIPSMTLYFGYRLGSTDAGATPKALSSVWKERLSRQQAEIDKAKLNAQDSLNALALRLGQMQAHVMRLDALGERLTKVSGLDSGEFDFNQPPAQGGPEAPGSGKPMDVPDFMSMLDGLERQLDDRGQQLSVLQSMLMNRHIQAEVFPAGRPIKGGWISSRFGMRTDPFTGKLEQHNGIDFADKRGTKVHAVASGIVTWAGSRFGYGNLVEIDHGNGYSTRYGHNEKVLVHVGETVKKGQTIALMGSTGRSTGPHCHFEVRINGRPVDPAKYVASR